MRCRDRHRAALGELLENCPAERGALYWIRAGSELVDDDERVCSRATQDLGEVFQMCAERRQACLNRLLVSDVSECIVEDRNAAFRTDGRGDARLRQRRDEA